MRKFFLLILGILCLLCPLQAEIRYALPPVGFEDGALPLGWTQENIEGAVDWQVEGGAGVSLINPAGAKQGDWRIAVRRPEGSTMHYVTRLVSPAVDVTEMRNPQLCFAHAQVASFDYFDTLRVYYRPTATAPWALLEEYTQPVTAWKTETIALEKYLQGTAYQIAFEVSDHAGKGVVLDDISILQPSLCQAPQFQMIEAASGSVYIEFVAGGTGYGSTADLFDIVVSDSALADPAQAKAGEVVYMQKGLADNSVTVSNLKSYTTYYVYLRTNCVDNGSGYTDWVMSEFRTTMIKSLPYTEDFNMLRGSSDFATQAGWTFGTDIGNVQVPYVYVGTTATYKQSYSVDSTSYLALTGAASTSVTAIAQGNYVYAATPELDGDLSKCEVSFWGTAEKYVYNGVTDYAAEVTVGVMTNPADYTTFTAVKTVKVESAYQFKHFVVSLAGYSGTGRYVALCSVADKQNVFFIDNFSVAVRTVAVPEDVRAYNVLPTGFDVAASVGDADSWNIRVSSRYVRDGGLLSDTECIVNQMGNTTPVCHISDADIAGKTVMIYAQAVKNGVASAWSFPVTLRVPTAGALPVELAMNTGTYTEEPLYNLNNEIHSRSSEKALKDVFFPLRSFEYLYPKISTSSPVYDGGHLDLNGIDNYIVLPYIDNVDSLLLTFRLSVGSTYSSYAGQSRVAVGMMTDPYDLSTFVEIAQFDGECGSYAKCEADFLSYTGIGHYVAIRAIAPATASISYGSYNALDNIVLQKMPSCLLPLNVAAVAAVNTVSITWDARGMDKWLVSLFSDSGAKTLLRDTVVTSPAVVLDNLSSNTLYYYTVRTICGSDTLEIADEEIYTFGTAAGIPFREIFAANTMPFGWSVYTGLLSDIFGGASLNPSSGTWYVGSDKGGVTTEGNTAYINIYGSSCKHWLVMPDLYIGASEGAGVSLSFEAALVPYSSYGSATSRNSGTDDRFAVVISTDAGLTWTRANATVWNNANDGTADYVLNDLPWQMQRYRIDLSQYIGTSVRIAFYAESTVSNADNYLLIDNVTVSEFDADCVGIFTLSAEPKGSSQGYVMWTAGGMQSVHLDVYQEGTTKVFDGDITVSPYLLTGLDANTVYQVEAYQSCNVGGDTLKASFRTECSAVTPEMFGTEDFADPEVLLCWNVGIGDTTGVGSTALTVPFVKKLSGFGNVLYMEKPKDSDSYYSSSHYGNNYYAVLPALDIDSIGKYQVVFDAATTSAASDTANVKKLYVGVATDPADLSTFEITDTLTLHYAADSISMRSYAIGFDTYQGDYLGDYGKYVVFMVAAPRLYSDIAVIDNVRMEEVSACHQVLEIEADDITPASATLRWKTDAGSARVVLASQICNPDTVSSLVYDAVSSEHFVEIQGLASATTYYAYVKAICGAGDSARWSGFLTFTTAYGIPYQEDFTENSLTTDWRGYVASFPNGKDTLSLESVLPSANSTSWYMTSAPKGIVGMNDVAARVEVYGSGSYNALLVSPRIWLPESVESDAPMAVCFKAAKAKYSYSGTDAAQKVDDSADDKLSIMVSLDDGKTWTRTDSKVWASDDSGDYNYNDFSLTAKSCRVDISAYAGKNIRIGFYTESTVSAPDTHLYIDSVSVDYYQPTCDGLTMVTVVSDSITANSASLLLKPQNVSDTLEYVYGIDAVDLTTAVPLRADSVLVGLSGLTPSSHYVFYARALCQSGDTSAWFGPVSFDTKCLAAVPVSYDFDDADNRYTVKDGKQMENCWEVRYSSSYYVPQIQSNSSSYTYSHSGTSALYMEMSSYSDNYAVAALPVVDADLDTLQLSFMARAGYAYSSSGTVTMSYANASYLHSVLVGTMDNLNDTSTFRLVKEVVVEPIASGIDPASDATAFWRQQVVSLEGAKGRYLVFMQKKGSKTNYLTIDDVSLSRRSDCSFVEQIAVDSITDLSARVHWTSLADRFYVTLNSAYSADSFVLEDTVYTFTGLSPNLNYTVTVASVCGTDTTFAVGKTFTTRCGLPFIETFEDGIPVDWQRMNGNILAGSTAISSTRGWTYSSATTCDVEGPKMVWKLEDAEFDYYYYDYYYYEQNSVLSTPDIIVRSAEDNPVMLGFELALTAASGSSKPSSSVTRDRKFAILVSEDSGATWLKIDSLVWGTDAADARSFDSIPATATQYMFDFSAYKGKTIRIAFYAHSPANGGSAYLHLRNVSLKEKNLNCLQPALLSADSISIDGAELVWHSEPASFEVQLASNSKFSNVMLDTVITDTTLVLHALEAGTEYYARVRTICGDKSYSDWCKLQFTTTYGIPFVEEFSTVSKSFPAYWEQYSGVTLSALLNTASPFLGATPSTNWGYSSLYSSKALADGNHVGIEMYSAYSDNWLVSPVIDLSKAVESPYLVFSFDAALTYWNSAATPLNTADQCIYLIVSEDGGVTWNKENLIMWSDNALDSADYPLASIPNGAGKYYWFDFTKYAGKTIRIAFGVNVTSNDNRLHIDNIRLEEAASVCFGVENVEMMETMTSTTATGRITPAEADSSWQYVYGPSGFVLSDDITVHSTDTVVFTLSDLESAATYDVYVRSVCGEGDVSAWYGPVSVTTAQVLPFIETFDAASTPIPAEWGQYGYIALSRVLEEEMPFAGANVGSNWSCSSAYNGNALADAAHIGIELYSSSSNSWLLTPRIEMPLIDEAAFIRFSFDMALTYWSSAAKPSNTADQRIYLIVSEDGGVTWNKENLIMWSDNTSDSADYRLASVPNGDGKHYQFDFTKYAGKTIQIAFGINATGNDNRLHIDNIALETTSSLCIGVIDLLPETVLATSTAMAITPSAFDSAWQYVYGIKGFNIADSVIYDTDTTVFTMSNLAPATEYDVYVRSLCASRDTSEWVGASFQTLYVLPLSEDFTDIDTAMPEGWACYSDVKPSALFGGSSFVNAALSSYSGWGYSSSYNENAFNGDNHISVALTSTYSDRGHWLVSPAVEMTNVPDSANVALIFDLALTEAYGAASPSAQSLAQTFYVAISTDAGKTWQQENATLWSDKDTEAEYTLHSVPNGMGETYTLNLSGYVGKTIRIAFGASYPDYGTSVRLHLDNIYLGVSSHCFEVERIEQVSVTRSSLTLQVDNANRKAQNWQYVYGVSGFDRADSLVHTTDVRQFFLSDLQAATSYDVYVRAVCGNGDSASWSGPFTVATAFSVPLIETFDDIDTHIPDLWKRYNNVAAADLFAGTKSFVTAQEYTSVGSTIYWGANVNNMYALSDTNHIGVEIYGSTSGAWLVTPCIDLSGVQDEDKLVFSFDAALTYWNSSEAPSSSDNQRFYILVSEDAGANWSKDNAILWSNAEEDGASYRLADIPKAAGRNYMLDFTSYVGKTIRIALGVEATANDNRLHIDNIELYTAASVCLGIDRLSLQEASHSSLDMRIETDDTSVQWQYAYGISGFVLSDAAAVYSTSTPEFVISDLANGTAYDVYVRTVCGVGDTSRWVGPFAFGTLHAVPFSETFDNIAVKIPDGWKRYNQISMDELLTSVHSFATAHEYVSTTGNWSSSSYNGYALADANHISAPIEYSATNKGLWLLTPCIDLSSVSEEDYLVFSFDAALTSQYSGSAPSSTDGLRFCFVVSEDGGATWSRSNAVLWSDAPADSAQYRMKDIPEGEGISFMFDFTAYKGKRIQVAFGVEATSNSSRLHIDNVRLATAGSFCLGVRNVKSKSVSGSSLTLVFTPDDATAQWQYAYGQTGFPLDDRTPVYTIDTTEFTITGLKAQTQYDIYVRTLCADSNTSAWVGPYTASTAFPLPFEETFDDMATLLMPADWTRYKSVSYNDLISGTKSFCTEKPYTALSSSENSWGYHSSYSSKALTDGNHIAVELYSSFSGSWLLSPVIDMASVGEDGKVALSFDAALTKWSSADAPSATATQRFYICISDDAGATWTRTNTVVWGEDNTADYLLADIPNAAGTSYELDMSGFAGKNIQIAFGVEASSNDNRLHIDNVRLRQLVSYAYSASACNSADYQDRYFTVPRADLQLGSKDYTTRLSGLAGAPDTLVTLTLEVYPAARVAINDTICRGYTYDNGGFRFVADASTVVPMVFTSSNGCDSLVELHLEVIPTVYVDTTIKACRSYTYGGITYYSDRVFTDTLVSRLGCDSIVRTFLHVSSAGDSETTWRTSVCTGDTYDDDVFHGLSEAGVYTRTVQTEYGCDSTVTLYLLVADRQGMVYDTVMQSDLPYIFEGETFLGVNTKVGDYQHDIQSSCGQVTLHMHVYSETALESTYVHPLLLTPNPAAVGQPVRIVSDLPASADYVVSVFSSVGGLVYRSDTPVGYLPGMQTAGVYTVRILTDGKVFMAKLLVR